MADDTDLAWAFAGNRLELTLFVTEKCNFRCTYCYEDFELGRMRDDVVEGICRLIERRATGGLEELWLSFFGGEPLLALPVVKTIASRALAVATETSGINYVAGVTTNAWGLTVDTARDLRSVGVSQYQVTLDGPADAHNRTRVLIDGRPTFDRIWRNLQDLQASDLDLKVRLRCHVTADNVDEWITFAPEVLLLANDPRFVVDVHPVGHWGGVNDGQVALASRSQLDSVLALFPPLVGGTATICYAAKPTALAIRADGTIARCTVALSDPRNRVGSIDQFGSLEIDQPTNQEWLRGWNGRADLLACPLAGLPRRNLPVVAGSSPNWGHAPTGGFTETVGI